MNNLKNDFLCRPINFNIYIYIYIVNKSNKQKRKFLLYHFSYASQLISTLSHLQEKKICGKNFRKFIKKF